MRNFIISICTLALSMNVQAQDVSSEAKDSTQAQSIAKKVDKSYFDDYAKMPIQLFIVANNADSSVKLKTINANEFVFTFTDGTGDISISNTEKTNKLKVKPSQEDWTRARTAYGKGEYDTALEYLRNMAYPILKYTSLSDEIFSGNIIVEFFLTALDKSGRINEAVAVAKEMPLAQVNEALKLKVLNIVKNLSDEGRTDEAFEILDELNIDTTEDQIVDELMATLFKLRQKGASDKALKWYTKLGNTQELSCKNEALLWMIYCDLAQGNRVSADLYLEQFKDIQRQAQEYSLRQLVKGMSELKGDDVAAMKGALDSYAEGIVFGSLENPWMTELLYRAGILYKKIGNIDAANEIFKQIVAMYPNDSFAKNALKDIVEKKENDDDDEDDND